MVVTPKEAIRLNLENDRLDIARLESKIDSCLNKEYSGRPVEISVRTDYDTKVIEQVKRKYRAAGWNVRLEDDPRHGPYFIFEEART